MATYRIHRLFDVMAAQRADMEFADDAAAEAYLAGLVAEEMTGAYPGGTPLRDARMEIEDGAEEGRVRFILDRLDDAGQLDDEIKSVDAYQDFESVEFAGRDLLAALRSLLPYAESRAEDMGDCADANASDTEAREAHTKAVAAVDAAKSLIASLDS